MANKKIIDYINNGLKGGYKIGALKKALLQGGWPEHEVNQAMQAVHRRLPKPQKRKGLMPKIRLGGSRKLKKSLPRKDSRSKAGAKKQIAVKVGPVKLKAPKPIIIKTKIKPKDTKPKKEKPVLHKTKSSKAKTSIHAKHFEGKVKPSGQHQARHPVRQPKPMKREFVKTGIKGLDSLLEKGIPKNKAILLAGGTGSGKTIMGLQMLINAARQGKKCLYMSFEESTDNLRQHMEDFGWKPKELEAKGDLLLKRFSIFDISRSLDALMAKSEGELLIEAKPIILPDGFKPDFIVVDSLTAIASAFRGRETYRSYIEHMFRYFEGLGVTSFMITETDQVPTKYSPTGVEEFLADGVIVLYNIRKGDIRENAIEILKMRGAKHIKKLVAMQVVSDIGIEVYPEQEVFGGIK